MLLQSYGHAAFSETKEKMENITCSPMVMWFFLRQEKKSQTLSQLSGNMKPSEIKEKMSDTTAATSSFPLSPRQQKTMMNKPSGWTLCATLTTLLCLDYTDHTWTALITLLCLSLFSLRIKREQINGHASTACWPFLPHEAMPPRYDVNGVNNLDMPALSRLHPPHSKCEKICPNQN